MKKSIENIWKEAFDADAKLSAPVISNFYEIKSKLVIQQINSKSKKDNTSLIPIAIIIFGVFAFFGEILIAAYTAILIFVLFFINKKMLKSLEIIDIKDTTYTYLLNYRNQVKKIMKYSTWIVGLGFPLMTIPIYWMFFHDTEVLVHFKELDIAVGILLVLGLALFLSAIGILSYRFSTSVVYRKLLERLEITIEDMEELMKK